MKRLSPACGQTRSILKTESSLGKVKMLQSLAYTIVLLLPIAASAQPNAELLTYFRQNVGLSDDQIASIRNGQPVAKALPSRSPAEVFLFGAVFIHAAPEGYVKFAHD